MVVVNDEDEKEYKTVHVELIYTPHNGYPLSDATAQDLWLENVIQKYLKSESLIPDDDEAIIHKLIDLCPLEGLADKTWMKIVLDKIQRDMIFFGLSIKLNENGLDRIEEYKVNKLCKVKRKKDESLSKPITFYKNTGVWLLEGILLEESKQELITFLGKVEKYCPHSLEDYLKWLDFYITECFIPSPTVSLEVRGQLIYPTKGENKRG